MEELSEQEKHRPTLEGLADVDAGRVIDHCAIQAWADNLATEKPLPPPRYPMSRRT